MLRFAQHGSCTVVVILNVVKDLFWVFLALRCR
jgi:hypothetical protein